MVFIDAIVPHHAEAAKRQVPRTVSVGPTSVAVDSGHLEQPRDRYMPTPAQPPGPRHRVLVSRDGFVSVQVNVDEFGANIVGDAGVSVESWVKGTLSFLPRISGGEAFELPPGRRPFLTSGLTLP